MVELNIPGSGEKQIPNGLSIFFSLLTTCLISVHVFALMISVCILPNIETVEQMHNNAYLEQGLGVKTLPTDSPHRKFRKYIEVAWIFSTGLGTLLFLMEIPVLMWVKFYNLSKGAVYVSTAIMVPVCILFVVFALKFYRKLVEHKHKKNEKQLEELQVIATRLGKDQETLILNSPKISENSN